MHATDPGVLFGGSPNNLVQEVPNHLVADRGDADPLSCPNEVDDHSRTSEGLARARRSLDGKNTAVECEGDPTRRGDRGFSGSPQCGPRNEPRVPTKQEIARSAEGTRAVDAMIANELPEAQ